MGVSKSDLDTKKIIYKPLQKCITTKLEDLGRSDDFAIYDVVFEPLLRVSVANALAAGRFSSSLLDAIQHC